MPRTARIELAGGIHHVTARGNRRQVIFRDDDDRRFFLAQLRATSDRFHWTCLSYCLMSNHYHLVIETPETTLGRGMHQLDGRHAQMFNSRHASEGHLFQGRYGSKLVLADAYLAQLLRYVALNPVAAGLCSDAAAWPWSSHRALIGLGTDAAVSRSRVEALLEAWGGEQGARYLRLFDPIGPLASRYGSDSPWDHRPPLAELLDIESRDEGMRAAYAHGYRLREIAEAVGLHVSNVSRRVRRSASAN